MESTIRYIYGRVKREIKASSLGDDVRPFIPFLYQGQYYDFETNLAYNRFRYYSPETGAYISQDPIGLMGGFELYSYVQDPNTMFDLFGLVAAPSSLPNTAGIYILSENKIGYVGSAGAGDQGMNKRISATSHSKAQELLKGENVSVKYREVIGLERVKEGGGRSAFANRKLILNYYEQKEFLKEAKKNKMTNGKKGKEQDEYARILTEEKMKEAKALIDEYNIKIKNRKTCK